MKCCEDSAPVAPVAKPTKQRKKGANWTDEETKIFLELCIEHNIIKLMDGKRHKHVEIFKLVEEKLKEMGFIKTASQLQIKMKHLKELYYKCKKTNNKSGESRREFLYYKQMDNLLNTRPKTLAMDEDITAGVDTSAEEDFVEADIRVLSPEEATALGESGIEIECSDLSSGEATNSNSTPSTSGLENRHRHARSQKGGATSYAKQMNLFSETIMANQTQALKEMLTEHTTAITTNIAQQLQQQREWEMEVMKREQEHSTKIMQMMINSFHESMHRHSAPTPTFYPQAPQLFVPLENVERHPPNQPRREAPARFIFDAAMNNGEENATYEQNIGESF